jgi:hypothetical protein
MRDGNGRTGRFLYEYIITKHLGALSNYRQIPLGERRGGEPTLDLRLMALQVEISKKNYPTQEEQVSGIRLLEKLDRETPGEIFNDKMFIKFAEMIKDILAKKVK